jgi:ADP-ribosyl-[dinitrogen reductase] hydrolase
MMKQCSALNSINSPLRIDSVKVPSTDGVIGMTFCPGKKDPYSLTGPWDRNLETDLQAIRAWGAKAVVTLMEETELDFLGVSALPEKVRQFGMQWFFLPVVDVSIPDENFESSWQTAGNELRQILRSGGKIVIHCRGGLGRTGTIAARLLVEFGMEPDEAIRAVRRARPGAIQTISQEEYILKCKPL